MFRNVATAVKGTIANSIVPATYFMGNLKRNIISGIKKIPPPNPEIALNADNTIENIAKIIRDNNSGMSSLINKNPD
jgi:hypothetical protein